MKLQNKRTIWTKVGLSLCVVTGTTFTGVITPARAADPVVIGVLDESKLGKDYVKYRSELDDLTRRADVLDKQLAARNVMNETEAKRFDKLILQTTRTPAEETEFQALIKVGADRNVDLTGLIGKAQRSADEEARLKLFQGYVKTNTSALRRLEDDLMQDLSTKGDAANKKYLDLANDMVKKVAIDKKLTVVLPRDAVIWFTPTLDITEEVLSRLNRQ